jgi:hypothetical protein
VTVGVQQEKIVWFDLGFDVVKRSLQLRLGAWAIHRHLVRSVITGPIPHRLRSAAVVKRAVVVQAGYISSLEAVQVTQVIRARSLQNLDIGNSFQLTAQASNVSVRMQRSVWSAYIRSSRCQWLIQSHSGFCMHRAAFAAKIAAQIGVVVDRLRAN